MLKIKKNKLVVTHNKPCINDECSLPIVPSLEGTIKLLTFNIQVGNNTSRFHHYITRSWQHVLPYKGRAKNLKQIAELARHYDLVALQEVDGGSIRSNGISQVEFLAKMANFPYWHQQTNRNLGKIAQHSNGMLSRFKPTLIEDHPLPGIRGRGAIFIRFGEGKDALIVVMMHLALRKKVRTEQLGYIYKLIAPYKHQILMGDMNADTLELLNNTQLKSLNLIPLYNEATYPSWKPKYSLDHILLSQELVIESFNVLKVPISDHLPIEVDIRLPNAVLKSISHTLIDKD